MTTVKKNIRQIRVDLYLFVLSGTVIHFNHSKMAKCFTRNIIISIAVIFIVLKIFTLVDKTESAKVLIRVDSWKLKGSKYVKTKLSYKNFANGSFALNSSFFSRQVFQSEIVSLLQS